MAVVGVQRRFHGLGATQQLLVAHGGAGEVAQLLPVLRYLKQCSLLDVAPRADAYERDVPAEALARLPCGDVDGNRCRASACGGGLLEMRSGLYDNAQIFEWCP